jgi:hypothetical protein
MASAKSILLASAAAALLFGPTLYAQSAEAPASPADWYDAVCANHEAILRYLAEGLGGIVGARILTDMKSVHQIPIIGPILAALTVNWPAILALLAKQAPPAAKAGLVLLAGLALTSLSACSSALDATPAVNLQNAVYYLKSVGCPLDQIAANLGASPTVGAIVTAQQGPAGTIALGLAETLVASDPLGLCHVTVPAPAVAVPPASS